MHYPIKKLSISGFTFFHGGQTYKDLFHDGHMDSIDIKGRKFGLSGGHGYQAHMIQVEYFRNLYKKNRDKIIIDNKLKRILSL